MRRILFSLALMGLPLLAPAEGRAPVPPCDGRPAWPRFPQPEAPPAIQTWGETQPGSVDWIPPACTGWSPATRSRLVVALAGTFRFKGDLEGLLARIGSISSLREVRYWSATDRTWRPLAHDASALANADPASRRPDFSASELLQGKELHYWMDDSRTGPAVYRMTLLERNREKAVVASENLSPLEMAFITLFRPGALQAVEFLERQGPDLWRVYLLSRVDAGASVFTRGQEASSINRLVALYRQLAGIPTDRDPPAMP